MKQRKMTKKQHEENVSIITFVIIVLAVGIVLAAVIMSVNNRTSYLKSLFSSSKETNNRVVLATEISKEVKLEVASTVATTSGNVSLNVQTNSSNPRTIKEYRYYIKESTKDMYVLDAIKEEEQHAYVKLAPDTNYDVKVEAVSYDGETLVSIASGETPRIDY